MLPGWAVAEPLLRLFVVSPEQKLDNKRRQIVPTSGTFGLRRPEQYAYAIGVVARPAHRCEPCVELEICPRETEYLGDAPSLHEQQRDRRAEAVVRRGSHQGSRL